MRSLGALAVFVVLAASTGEIRGAREPGEWELARLRQARLELARQRSTLPRYSTFRDHRTLILTSGRVPSAARLAEARAGGVIVLRGAGDLDASFAVFDLENDPKLREAARQLPHRDRFRQERLAAGVSDGSDRLAAWDRLLIERPVPGFAAGALRHPGDALLVTTHILAREPDEASLRRALAQGHAYIAHDWLCDPTGFAYFADTDLGMFEMGDRVPIYGSAKLAAVSPVPVRFRVIRDGTLLHESAGERLQVPVFEPGAYRLEAWLTAAGEERPWIYTNPLYFEHPAPDLIEFPSPVISPEIEALRDIVYTGGHPDDEPFHKLDLYLPRGAAGAPVLIFLHGGRWQSGHRAMYAAVGDRFARDGIVVAIPSYRLAPKDLHPAQAEDAAAAIAWVARNIGSYGGDPARLYIGGHSAGGHLAALAALNPRYLGAHGLSVDAIRGVICLSGVYWISQPEFAFGSSEATWRDASPGEYVRAGAPPFLLTFVQRDYPTLAAQAERFHALLTAAGVHSELRYFEGLGHVTEVLNLPKASDPVAQAVLRFLQ